MIASVIVPIFNQEQYLDTCLNSLVQQDEDNFEVILVDDGSTDQSEKICHEYVKKYNNFKYFYQKNSGLGEARNTGLNYATGKYILFLDSDDAFRENSISKLTAFAESQSADIVYFDEIICDDRLCVQNVAKTYPEMSIEICKVKAMETSLHPAHVWSRMYRRTLFKDIRFNNIWYEDIDILPKLIAVSNRLFYYKVPLYFYRQHTKGITHQESDMRNMNVITAWKNILDFDAYNKKELAALESSVKKSIYTFSFFRPQFAIYYLEYYNEKFAGNAGLHMKAEPEIEISKTPLWIQAKFFDNKFLCQLLLDLQKLFMEGGCLRINKEEKVCFEKCNIEKEYIALEYGERIFLKKICVNKGSVAVHKVIKELALWNLISLKNQIKEIKLTECMVKYGIEMGIVFVEDKDEK